MPRKSGNPPPRNSAPNHRPRSSEESTAGPSPRCTPHQASILVGTNRQLHQQPRCLLSSEMESHNQLPSQTPLNATNRICASTEEKPQLLVETLLQTAACTGDITINLADNDTANLPFPRATTDEIQQAILKAKSTTPGRDTIPNTIPKLSWPVIGTILCPCTNAVWR